MSEPTASTLTTAAGRRFLSGASDVILRGSPDLPLAAPGRGQPIHEVPLTTGMEGYAGFGDWNPWSRYQNPISLFFDFYQINPFVRGVCDKIAQGVKINRWQLVDETSIEDTHPDYATVLAWLLAIGYGKLRHHAALDLAICANAFFLVQRNALGQIMTLQRINPATMKPLGDAETGVIGWKQIVGHRYRLYPAEWILHIKGPNPVTDIIGLPLLTSALVDVESDNAMSLFNRAYFGNGTEAGTVLVYDDSKEVATGSGGTWSADDERRARDKFDRNVGYIERRFQNPSNAHLPLVLRGKWDRLAGSGQARADMQFLDGRKFNARLVCGLYGFPIEALGLGERGGLGGNLAEPAAEQLADVVAYYEGLIDQAFRDDFLVTQLGIMGLSTGPSSRPGKIAIQATSAALNMAKTGSYTRNEIRAVTQHGRLAQGGDDVVLVTADAITTDPTAQLPDTQLTT